MFCEMLLELTSSKSSNRPDRTPPEQTCTNWAKRWPRHRAMNAVGRWHTVPIVVDIVPSRVELTPKPPFQHPSRRVERELASSCSALDASGCTSRRRTGLKAKRIDKTKWVIQRISVGVPSLWIVERAGQRGPDQRSYTPREAQNSARFKLHPPELRRNHEIEFDLPAASSHSKPPADAPARKGLPMRSRRPPGPARDRSATGAGRVGETDPLADRERQVLRAAEEELASADIAKRLDLSEGSVRNYLSEAIAKLEVTNRNEAARLARQRGWL